MQKPCLSNPNKPCTCGIYEGLGNKCNNLPFDFGVNAKKNNKSDNNNNTEKN